MNIDEILIRDDAPAKVTERDMLDRLNHRYATGGPNGIRYARAEHVRVTAGFDARRICDYMTTIRLVHGGDQAMRITNTDVWQRVTCEDCKAAWRADGQPKHRRKR